MQLSKSKYMAGRQCIKRLWLEINDPTQAVMPETQQHIFEHGNAVGEWAQRQFSGGVLIESNDNQLKAALVATQLALEDGLTPIFEGTFFFDDVYVRVDVLTKNEDGTWNITEIKSATRVKAQYLIDLAVQRYVLQNNGLTIAKTNVMHIYRECVYPDLSNLFVTKDVTRQVDAVPSIALNLQAYQEMIAQGEPDIPIGEYCNVPYKCPFKKYCWRNVGAGSIFDIPRLHKTKVAKLQAQGIIRLADIPPDYSLSAMQWAFVKRMLSRQADIDEPNIKILLAQLSYPLHFLDFETDAPPIPRFDGFHPYDLLPFQYSCHIMTADGQISHAEYLHPDSSDPRLPLVESLLACIKPTGSVIAYNANFERKVLTDLAKTFPLYAKPLLSIAARLWDQLIIFKRYYHHPDFGKSISLKNVLPVVVPHLSYRNLTIRKGDVAQLAWQQLITLPDGPEKERLTADLKAYCGLDTLAMVELHRVLSQLTNPS